MMKHDPKKAGRLLAVGGAVLSAVLAVAALLRNTPDEDDEDLRNTPLPLPATEATAAMSPPAAAPAADHIPCAEWAAPPLTMTEHT